MRKKHLVILVVFILGGLLALSTDFSGGEYFASRKSGEILVGTKKGKLRIGHTKECWIDEEPGEVELKFHVFSFRLNTAICSSPECVTAIGAGIGDTREKVEKLYGTPTRSASDSSCKFPPRWMQYEEKGLTFNFDCRTGEVESIKLVHNRGALWKILRIPLDLFHKSCRDTALEKRKRMN